MKVVLAGASGAIGLPLAKKLRERGHEIVALHRTEAARAPLQLAGAAPTAVDVLDRARLLRALSGIHADAVISQLTAMKKPPMTHGDMALTNRLRTLGTANLLAAARQLGASRFVTQSMVFGYGYGDFAGRVLSETEQFGPAGRGRFDEHLTAMRSNEQQVLGADNLAGISLRYGLLYGPGASATITDGLRRRRLPVIHGGDVQPWVYLEDAVSATVAALERGSAGTAYNIADDEPVSFSDLLTAWAVAIGAPSPRIIPAWLLTATPYAKAMMTGGLRVSNAKAKAELDWLPGMPTYRDGLAAIAADDKREAA